MTQVVRQKWVLGLVAGNAVLGAALLALLIVLFYGRRGAAEAEELRDADVHGLKVHQLKLKTELEEARSEMKAAHAELEALRSAQRGEPESRSKPSSSDVQLSQTLQLLASQQQLLVLQSLRPAEPPKSVTRASARKSRSRVRRASNAAPVAPGCAVTP